MANQVVPGTLKGLETIIVTVGVGVAAYIIYKNNKNKQELAAANVPKQLADQELNALAQQGVNPTYSDTQFNTWVQQLIQAMNGCGTDEEQVYQIFRFMKSRADVLKLISAFGVQYYEPCSVSSPISYAKWLFDDQSFGGNLPTWLSYDLQANEIAYINDILKAANIDYLF